MTSLWQKAKNKITSSLLPREAPAWEGIYSSFAEVPKEGPGFSSPEWIRQSEAELRRVHGETPLPPGPPEFQALPLLVSLIAQRQKSVRILDFGGGMGITFEYLSALLGDAVSLEYVVLENETVCEAGKKYWGVSAPITFTPTIPTSIKPIDILFICSALQYVENYRQLLNELCQKASPRYILFTKLSAGDFPTYATAQITVQGSKVPYWFINLKEIVHILSENRYDLAIRSALERIYPQPNFPESHRMKRACNLLFIQHEEKST